MSDVSTKQTTVTTGGGKAAPSQTVAYIIYFLFGIVEILLIFRLIFKLTGANPNSSFVNSIYALSQIFIAPFYGIFPQASTQGVVTTAVLEPAALVAIVVYAVLAWGITQLVVILSGRSQ